MQSVDTTASFSFLTLCGDGEPWCWGLNPSFSQTDKCPTTELHSRDFQQLSFIFSVGSYG